MSKSTKAATTKAPEVNTDLIDTHKFTFGKGTYTGVDLANTAASLQSMSDDLADEQDVFGRKFILFARTCKSVDEFLSLCGSVEARQSWKSDQNKAGSETAPTVWKQYKSNIKTAWKNFDISPDKVDTVSKLNKALNEARKEKKAADDAKTGDSTTAALVDAVNVDSKLAAAIGSVTQTFDKLDAEQQVEMLSELHGIVAYFEDQLNATVEQDDDLEALEQHLATEQEQQAAAAH